MSAEVIVWIGVGIFLAVSAVGGVVAALHFKKAQGEVVARVTLTPQQPFDVALAPRDGGAYVLRLRVGCVVPRHRSSDTRAPSVRLEVIGAAGVLMQGDFRRQPGMDRDVSRSAHGDQVELHDTRDLVQLPPTALAGCRVRGALLPDASANVHFVSLEAVALPRG
ncbi:MAG: hypothetical protein RIF41_06095 [Polyangiaceae bacterium]